MDCTMCGFQAEYQEKVLHPESGQALGQAPQGSGHGTEPAGVKKHLDNTLRHSLFVCHS